MRYCTVLLFALVVVANASDIHVSLEYSDHGPIVRGAANQRYLLETTRVQTVVFPQSSNPIEIQFAGGNDTVVINELEEYPIEPINIFIEPESQLAVGIGSDFGRTIGDMMLLPTNSESSPCPIKMILRPSDPLAYCYENTMGYVHGSGLGDASLGIFTLKVAITVVETEESVATLRNSANEELDGSYHGYYIDTTSQVDRVPESVFYEWQMAVEQRGLTTESPSIGADIFGFYTEFTVSITECQRTRHLYPSIMYTILVGEGPENTDVAARIILSPEDYMLFDPNSGDCVVQFISESAQRTFKLGMNFIKRAALHFDYRNNRIGIGEPL